MRTEVKIGLVSCVLIIAIVLTFAMFRGDTDPQNDAKSAETTASGSKVAQTPANKPAKPTKPATTASRPSGSGNGTPVSPIKVNRPTTTPVAPSPVRPQRPSVTVPKPVTTTTIAPKTPLNRPTTSGTGTSSSSGSYYSPLAPSNATANKTTLTTTPITGSSTTPSPAVRINRPSVSTTTNTAAPTVIKPVVSKPRIYAVQEGDSGFYAIAQKLYGSQRYAYLIRNANRNAESNRLRVGQKLVIPPLPADAVNKTANNTAAVAASGARIHVVDKNDTAWDLAKKYYGAGKYMYLIEKANQGVNIDVLIVGQKLVIPKFQPSSSSSSGTSAIASGSGRIHTVESGDSAWKIAERYYGSGKYVYLIRDANKNVDIDNIKEGQKLVIPASKTASGSSSSASSGTGSSSSSTSTGGYTAPRPMFD